MIKRTNQAYSPPEPHAGGDPKSRKSIMLVTMNDLSPNARVFVQHCMENYSFEDLADMFYTKKRIEVCARFGITEQQWRDAIYVVVKQMGEGKNQR